MGFKDLQLRTITCNGPSCKKTVTFEVNQNDPTHAAKAHDENPWLKNLRIVQSNNNAFVFCSDECLIQAAGENMFARPEKKSILLPDGSNAVQVAAQRAAEEEAATRALKGGQPVSIRS